VLAVPNAALRTPRDVASAASVLGLDPQAVQQQLAAAAAASPPARAGGDTAVRGGAATPPGGRSFTPPAGVTREQMRAVFEKMRSGGELTDAERSLLAQVRGRSDSAGRQGAAGGRGAGFGRAGGGGRSRNGAASSYIVFILRGGKILPVSIRTGLSDQAYIEVMSGLTETDSVLVLPSASLVQAQQQFRQRFQSVTGGGLPGLRQQQAPSAPSR
jgi:hypothetical protein